jgi:hypothetical protein
MRKAALLFAWCAVAAATTAYSGDGNVRRSKARIPGRYIVVLQAGADTATVASTVRDLKGARVRHTYEKGLKGLSVDASEADAQTLARDPRVQFVEEDSAITAADLSWALDRVDQRFLPLNGSYVSDETGAGVTVYIVDTGILAEHREIAGRVSAGFSAFSGDSTSSDCNGHGTHVAGIVGGSSYGVATSATLVPVRVLNCNGEGSLSTVLAGLDWVLQDHAQTPGPAVVNMSLGGGASSSLDAQVDKLLGAGMTAVVAAGNSNSDACTASPARVPGVLTVGATTATDERASFSNYGACVDLFAPGENIVSSWHSGPTSASVTSGTSAAAPFVAGVAALALQKYPDATPASIAQTLVSQATLDTITSAGAGSPNRLLFSLIGSLENGVQSDSQLLADPSFDFGDTFWSLDVCTVINPAGCRSIAMEADGGEYAMMGLSPRSGSGHAAIGGPAASFQLTSEIVVLPLMVRRAALSAYLRVVTKSKSTRAHDLLTVEIRDQAGTVVETLGSFSNLDAAPMYGFHQFDVTRYRGRAIRVSFSGDQSVGAPTWFLVDDVALNVWR